MAKTPKKTPVVEDEEQSRKFLETVRELEAAGELNPTDADRAFDRAFRQIVKPRPKTS